jgi:hypothetical protein
MAAMRIFRGLIGAAVGATAGWFLPSFLTPHPREFDFIAILGWRMLLVPAGAIIGLIVGLRRGDRNRDSESESRPNPPANP